MLRKFAHQITPPVFVGLGRRAFKRPSLSANSKEENELQRLRNLPEGQPTTTTIFGRPFEILDGSSFAHLFGLYFKQRTFKFKAANQSPYIIDCGANIGVTVAWWKHIYPNARVLAFEADPEIFQVLKRNCSHLENVQLINAAIWDEEGKLAFSAKGNLGGHVAEFSSAPTSVQSVPCVRLHPFLADGCDFLKMDIEGAEVAVLQDCSEVLGKVARAFVEYHSFVGRSQSLGQTINVLEAAGFRLHVHTELPSPQPFEELIVVNQKDLRLDLFCYRE